MLPAYCLEQTGSLRRDKLLVLLWTDLDIENRVILVTKQVNRVNGKLKVRQPETSDSIRTTPIPKQAAAEIKYIRFHDLRHTFATLSLQNGVDVKTLSSILGHYSVGFALDTYTHAAERMKREAANTIGNVIATAM